MGHHLPLNCLNCLPEFPEMLAGVEPEHEPYLNLTSVWAPVLRESIMEFREKFPVFFVLFFFSKCTSTRKIQVWTVWGKAPMDLV